MQNDVRNKRGNKAGGRPPVQPPMSLSSSLPIANTAPRRVAFSAVRAATGDFAAARKIGEGGTGEVFSGELDDAPVAVKALKLRPLATPKARAALEPTSLHFVLVC